MAGAPKRVTILGSTGSIGRSALEVIRAAPGAFEVVGLSAFRSVDLLLEQAEEFGARRVVVGEERAGRVSAPAGVEMGRGADGLERLASDREVDLVLNALVGSAGLRPALATAGAGVGLALANKESLVMAGGLITEAARESGTVIVPVDSEHNAIFRCLRAADPREVEGVVLTASGGPLRDVPRDRIAGASVDDVLAHPTWSMGTKVTVDSATLVNKAMEVIEAHWLFGFPYERIEVALHRESIVHSFVRLSDGTMLAHLAPPDMRVPIQYALYYPDPPPEPIGECRAEELGRLTFEPVEPGRYPCFEIVMGAARAGGGAPLAAATADEVAVEAFVEGRIAFDDIAAVIEETLAGTPVESVADLDSALEQTERARSLARRLVEEKEAARGVGSGGAKA